MARPMLGDYPRGTELNTLIKSSGALDENQNLSTTFNYIRPLLSHQSSSVQTTIPSSLHSNIFNPFASFLTSFLIQLPLSLFNNLPVLHISFNMLSINNILLFALGAQAIAVPAAQLEERQLNGIISTIFQTVTVSLPAATATLTVCCPPFHC